MDTTEKKLRDYFFDSKYDDTMSFDEFKIKMGDKIIREIEQNPMKGVKKRGGGGSLMTDKQKKFAKLAPPKDKITYADKIAGATKNNKVREAKDGAYGGGNFGGDEVLAAGRSRGGGAAIKGTKFTGVY